MKVTWFLAIFLLTILTIPTSIYGSTYYTSDSYLRDYSKYSDFLRLIQEVENNDNKSNLEPFNYVTLTSFPRGPISKLNSGFGFASQSDIDYWLFPTPDRIDYVDDPSLLIYFDMYVYTLDPKNGTWVELLFETSEGDFEAVIQVEVPQNQSDETIFVTKNELSGIGLEETFATNIYAIWENNKTITESPEIHAYKTENETVLPKYFYQNKISIDNATSTNLTEEFSWRLPKFKISLLFNFFDKSASIVESDMFLRIFSPLGLMYSYEFFYELTGKEFIGLFFTMVPWPIYIILILGITGLTIVVPKIVSKWKKRQKPDQLM